MRTALRILVCTRAVVWSAALGCISVAGCTGPEFPKTYPVSGTVSLPDGKPLQTGNIEFESIADPNLRGFGELEQDGTFARVFTYNSSGREVEGLIAGEHRVRLEVTSGGDEEGGGRDPGEDQPGQGPRRRPPLIDSRYRAFDTSGLKISIPAPDNRVAIKLSKP